MATHPAPRVVADPIAARAFQRGVNLIIDAVRPTLGPTHRLVAVERNARADPPEMLASAGVIARRIIAIDDPDADVGAMFARHLIHSQAEREGDGAATVAVLFQSIYNQGLMYIAAGGSVPRLRQALQEGAELVAADLERQAVPVADRRALTRVAMAASDDVELSELLGEIFEMIGEHGRLEIQSSPGRALAREFVEGSYWDGGVFSQEVVVGRPGLRAEVWNPAIVLSDLKIEEPDQLIPLLRAALAAEVPALFLVAQSMSDKAMGVLRANQRPGRFEIVAVKLGGLITDFPLFLQDMAYLTGARPFIQDAGDSFATIQPGDFGRARKAWADREHFGFVGGQGDPLALRAWIDRWRAAWTRAADPEERRRLRARLGRLQNGSAVLWIGGATEPEVARRRDAAERAVEAARGALCEGVVPGGGVALLACQPTLRQRLAQAQDPDEQAAYRILLRALEAPARTILANAGLEPGAVWGAMQAAGPGYGYDVRAGRVVNMLAAGICDAASVQRSAIRRAVHGAGAALAIGALVHRKRPPESTTP